MNEINIWWDILFEHDIFDLKHWLATADMIYSLQKYLLRENIYGHSNDEAQKLALEIMLIE
jgi:hypothetical protein